MEKFTHGEITGLAKQICKTNSMLLDAIIECEDLSKNPRLKELLFKKNVYASEWDELVSKVKKYTRDLQGADARMYGADLDNATDIFTQVYEDIEDEF